MTPTWTGFSVTAVALGSWTNQGAVPAAMHWHWVGAVSVSELYAAPTRH